MNNNICKWGVEHQKSLLEKGKNLSRRLVKKILLSLSLLGMLFVGGNAYAAADFPVTDHPNWSDYKNSENIYSGKKVIEDNIFDDYYCTTSYWGTFQFKSDQSDLTVSNSYFDPNLNVVIGGEDSQTLSKCENVTLENVVESEFSLSAQNSLNIKNLSVLASYKSPSQWTAIGLLLLLRKM